jgi:hypothetical protein
MGQDSDTCDSAVNTWTMMTPDLDFFVLNVE